MAEPRPRTWNLFARKAGSGLYCAVPDDCPLPSFIRADTWELMRQVSDLRSFPRGFNDDLAFMMARLNGFYVFHGAGP